jgi:hypothetical protein
MKTQTSRLSPEQLKFYNDQGYLIYRDQVLPAEKFLGLKNHFAEILENLSADSQPEVMDMPHFLYPELYKWIFDNSVLDLVEPIIGSNIALFASAFLCKPKGNGKRVPWHEDSIYWKTTLHPMEVVTIWLAIDSSTRENGCMNVIPGSHMTGKKGFSDYDPVDTEKNAFAEEITKAQLHTENAVAIELQPGMASLHDARLVHGSAPNHSTARRCGYTMRFMSSAVKFNHEKCGAYHQIFLARGQDLAGNVYGDPSKNYSDLARFRTKRGKSGH